MNRSDPLLTRLLEAARRGQPLDAWAADPDAMARLVRSPDFGAILEAVAAETPPPSPTAPPDQVAAAAVDGDGAIVVADERFRAWLGDEGHEAAVAASVASRRGSLVRAGVARDGAPIALAYGAAAVALGWTLPDEVRRALQQHRAAAAILAVCPSRATDALLRAAAAYGLTPAEARLAGALTQHGNLATAAKALGVREATARRTLADVLRKVGVNRQAALIERITRLALGYWPRGGSDPALLTDAFGLSPRQAKLAQSIATGRPRAEAARAAAVSDAVAKDEIERIYELTGVSSAAALSRLLAETSALGVLARVSNGALAPSSEDAEPLRFAPRHDGSLIAYSDYGPRGGRPVCVLHSSSTTRHVSRTFVRHLQDAGFRPFAIDRPGFGMTDTAPADYPGDAFEAAARDMRFVFDALRVERADIVARGGGHAAYAFARDNDARVGAVVCLNPDALRRTEDTGAGMLGALSSALLLHQHRLSYLARIIIGEASPARVSHLLRQALQGSAPDLAALEQPGAIADYQRAVRHFAAGRVEGFIAEQRALATPREEMPLARSINWRVFYGVHDPLCDAETSPQRWQARLPGAGFERFADGGRFLFLTHPGAIISALRSAA
ncbi:MAG: alpha/beta fold hydrolase [Hyphomonadaceae bacterium]